MVTRNDSGLKLFNGDVGILIQDKSSGQLRAVFEGRDQFRSFSIHVLPSYQSAFAITVHKSQGSEFDRILMPLPDDENHKLLTREILYTGLTRAKKNALIYAKQKSLKRCINNQNVRQTGLKFWHE